MHIMRKDIVELEIQFESRSSKFKVQAIFHRLHQMRFLASEWSFTRHLKQFKIHNTSDNTLFQDVGLLAQSLAVLRECMLVFVFMYSECCARGLKH